MRALVSGATGQDGQYLCELLLEKGYEVHGLQRPTTTERKLIQDVQWHIADLSEAARLREIVLRTKPDEVYNLAAQSHVGASFQHPELTFNVNALGAQHMLGAAFEGGCKFYQASTSELFGNSAPPQNEATPFRPRSPYAVAKLAAYWSTVNYREAYGMFACNGILFNHESPRRGPEFVTRKISKAVAGFANGRTEPLRLGNLDAARDWGHAKDYVEGMWLMLQQELPMDYVLATGEMHSVREFVETAFEVIGRPITWYDEFGVDKSGRSVVVSDPALMRPAEVPALRGDATKAQMYLGWQPKHSFRDLVGEMVLSDIPTQWHA